MDKSENFIEKYKHLEDVVRMTYNLREADSISYYLTNQAKYARFADELRYCQKVRNFLVHEKKVNDNFAVEVSKSMLDFIDSLIDSIVNQPRCSDVQIKFRDIYWRSINDTVNETMSVMRDKLFTHVPILDDECTVIGVFDENAMFTYIAEEGIVSIDEEWLTKRTNYTSRQIMKLLRDFTHLGCTGIKADVWNSYDEMNKVIIAQLK